MKYVFNIMKAIGICLLALVLLVIYGMIAALVPDDKKGDLPI